MCLDEPRVSIQQAARILGVSYKTIWRWVTEQKLDAQRVGKQYRIRKSDLNKDIGRQTEVKTVEPSP